MLADKPSPRGSGASGEAVVRIECGAYGVLRTFTAGASLAESGGRCQHVLRCREQARRVYYVAVFEIKREIPENNSGG
jgi:hypothetical protein